MVEATPQKRVLPARERAESAAKRQAASPATPSATASEPRQKRPYTKRGTLKKVQTSAPGTPTSSTPTEETLPNKIQSSRPLPTASHKQSEKLSSREYQSIAESAVLVASLHRSRMQWLCEGIFKWYWTKPVKRKGVIEQRPGNPDGKLMAKLGNATMTIEPHVFDVTFYTVKDSSNIPPPYYRHPNQHTAKQTSNPPITPLSVRSAPQNIPPPKVATPKPVTPAASSATATAPAPAPVLPTGTATTPNPDTPVKQEASSVLTRSSETPSTKPASPVPISKPAPSSAPAKSTSTNATPPPPPPHPIAHAPTQSVAPAPASKPANDPVIQMLAARAANDERLRELMKVVATSQASVEQLKEFQAHIDEFNRIIKQKEAKKVESEKAKPPPAPAAAHPATYSTPARPYPGPPTSIGGPMHMAPPSYAGYPPPRPEPFIKHIVVEFHSAASATQSATNDRWLFPEHAVLDIKSGGTEMIASFFVVRKGEDILKRHGIEDGGGEDNTWHRKFKPDVEYYQPVTVVVKATQHKVIETIARAAKSLPECQSYMKEVMEKKTRAPQEYLVLSLPREKALPDLSGIEFVDSAVELSNDEDDELKDVYKI